MMGGFGIGGFGTFGMLFGMGFYLLLFVGLIVLAVWGIGQFTRGPIPVRSSSHGNGLEILKTRYARGEITKVEYDQMKAAMG